MYLLKLLIYTVNLNLESKEVVEIDIESKEFYFKTKNF